VSRLALFCVVGWSIAIVLLCWAAPRAYRRWVTNSPSAREAAWVQTLNHKQAQLAATTWKDARPLIIFGGDSHVELGNWYELCAGSRAVRNCGLSAARIEDVATLMAVVPDRKVDTVLLMCGINNLGRGESAESCAQKYANLLAVVASSLKPQRIIVLSVMPVRQSDEHTRRLNESVSTLNGMLAELCRRNHAVFLNVNGAVTNTRGSLADELTVDGLHLNTEGYRAISAVLCGFLTENRPSP